MCVGVSVWRPMQEEALVWVSRDEPRIFISLNRKWWQIKDAETAHIELSSGKCTQNYAIKIHAEGLKLRLKQETETWKYVGKKIEGGK